GALWEGGDPKFAPRRDDHLFAVGADLEAAGLSADLRLLLRVDVEIAQRRLRRRRAAVDVVDAAADGLQVAVAARLDRQAQDAPGDALDVDLQGDVLRLVLRV